MASEKRKQRVVVVGAGPVGALAALYAANRGDQVDLYELRSDLRYPSTTPFNFTRSINLALSERGINAMKHSGSPGLLEGVMQETIPMYGRMIHSTSQDGALLEKSQQYDINRRAIHAIDRGGLNRQLLDTLEALPNVTIHFNHKLTGADFNRKKAWFEKRIDATGNEIHDRRPPEIEVDFDFMIGADGAHSSVRYHLMKFTPVDYSQEYIDTLWCEFHIEPDRGSFAMSPNHLHIWPGSSHMFIAIPSMDRTFTCTLFAPRATFRHLAANPNEIPQFFQRHFPGVSPERIAPNDLIAQFTSSPHLPLISLKCSPYHFSSSLVIVGDAAHAMVPFYGQGMNAGLEDIRVLFEFLDTHGVYPWDQQPPEERDQRRARALEAYTSFRVPDTMAINELALANYIEMRSKVVSPIYLVRKVIEEAVSRYIPSSGWTTQYTRVSFSNERYSHVVNSVQRQGKVLHAITAVLLVVMFLISLYFAYCYLGRSGPIFGEFLVKL